METILKVENLKKHFEIIEHKQKLNLKAVDDVSFEVYKGETLGVVGESGCGKSTLGKTLMHLYEKTDGSVKFKDMEISDSSGNNLKNIRKQIQMIFQDPFSSLNPRKKVSTLISQPLKIHNSVKKSELPNEIKRLLNEVGLDEKHSNRYPHQFSGGQRQRIGIARALALRPEFIICDEAVSALDVSVQAQIINLLKDIQGKYNFTYLFISHDLSVVEFISDRIMVMYLGKIVEIANTDELIQKRLHPYTKALFESFPNIDPRKRNQKKLIEGDVPSPVNPPKGCHFHPRCPHAMDICREKYPEMKEVYPGHFTACFLYQDK